MNKLKLFSDIFNIITVLAAIICIVINISMGIHFTLSTLLLTVAIVFGGWVMLTCNDIFKGMMRKVIFAMFLVKERRKG